MSHKLYIHESGTLPDRFNLIEEAIDIEYGKKYDITLTAGAQKPTMELIEDLSPQERQCITEEESKEFRASTRILDKYSMSNCIMEKLVEKGNLVCNCTPWDWLVISTGQTSRCVLTPTESVLKMSGPVLTT